MKRQQIHFITGRLAESALRRELERLSAARDFAYTIQVMPISVAALMTGTWIARRIDVPDGSDEVVLPGYVGTGCDEVQRASSVPVRLGPKDLRDLATLFGEQPDRSGYGSWDVEIIAEINHVPQLELPEVLSIAQSLVRDGADIVDIGCDPAGGWTGVGETVQMLREAGIRVSIDSFDPCEVSQAVAAGAELVLSVNSTNCRAAPDWGCEVVVVPDDLRRWEAMESTMEFLAGRGVPFRVDPVLEPVGIGLGASLARFVAARTRWPDVEILMGIGNVTELTDADSAAINLILIGICQEQSIRSVLTTQVINWSRTSVRECQIARQIAWYAHQQGIPAKRISEELLIVRDASVVDVDQEFLEELSGKVKDRNYRIFSGCDGLSVIGDKTLWQGADPFVLVDRMLESQGGSITSGHAFYLGYEMCKAEIARQLGKRYTQDEALDWGYLTQVEPNRHRLEKRRADSSGVPDSHREGD